MGVREFSSLRFMGVLFLWVGYHLSPWLSFLSGDMWESYLTVPYLIDEVLIFSSVSMVSYLFGYGIMFDSKYALFRKEIPIGLALPSVKPAWVIITSILVLTIIIVSVGGLSEFWASSNPRGYGQFDQKNLGTQFVRAINVLTLPLVLILSVMSCLLILKPKKSPLNVLIGLVGLAVACSNSIWGFSRAAGFPFLLLGFIALRAGVRDSKLIGVMSFLIVFMLGSVGYGQRSYFNPGIGNFVNASIAQLSSSFTEDSSYNDDPFINTLDATPAFTRKAEIRIFDNPDVLDMAFKLIWNLNPLPSEFFPIYQLGTGLTEAMGVTGSTGLTTPALAELYYVFGMSGFLFLILIGMISGWFERRSLISPSFFGSLGVMLLFMSYGVGLHNGIRSMTRPILYAFVLLFFSNFLIKRRK